MVVSKHDDELAMLRAELDHLCIRAETHGEEAAHAKQLQVELDDMRTQQQVDKTAWTTERDDLTRQVEVAERAAQEVRHELDSTRATLSEKETAWNGERESNAAKLADSMNELQRLMKELEELQRRHNHAQQTYEQAILDLQEELTTMKTQQVEKDNVITTSTNEMNDLRHALTTTNEKLLASEKKFVAAEEERQRLLVLENSKAQIAAAEMRLTFSEERRKLKEELV